MSDAALLICPFDANPTPIYQQMQNANDGTPRWEVICPVCRNHTPLCPDKDTAAAAWNARRTLTYVTWEALIATFVATVPTMAELSAYVIAHPPVAD